MAFNSFSSFSFGAAIAAAPAPAQGERVLANSRAAGLFHPGIVAAAHANGTFDVCYTVHKVGGCDTETHVPTTHIVKFGQMSASMPHGLGTRVLANSQNGGVYHAGTIARVNTTPFGFTYDVQYQAHTPTTGGSDVESGIPPSYVELNQPTSAVHTSVTPKAPARRVQPQPQPHPFGSGSLFGAPSGSLFGPATPTATAPPQPRAPPAPLAPPAPRCNANHPMKLTTSSRGVYANGWACDACSSAANTFTARYCCEVCTHDYCVGCAGQMMESAAAAAAAKQKHVHFARNPLLSAATGQQQQQPPRVSRGGGGGGPTRTHIAMLVDRSGSMQSMGREVAGGVNSYLDDQREFSRKTGAITSTTIATFDHQYTKVYDQNLATLPRITEDDLKPRGQTALYDAIGKTLADTEAKLSIGRGTHLDKVIIFILTDGHENCSHEHSRHSVQRLIAKYKSAPYNWEFFFAGANQDAVLTGSALGLGRDDCITFGNTPQKMRAAFGASSAQTRSCQQGYSKAFTPTQRGMCG